MKGEFSVFTVGRGVRILHCYGDQLWESGSKVEMPELGEPPGLDFLSKSEEKSDEDEADPDGESDSGDDLEAPDICEEEKITDDIASVVLNEESALPDDHNEIVEEDERSPQEIMDELLERAFLQERLILAYKDCNLSHHLAKKKSRGRIVYPY